jgi:ectoine hydroxylase-related dioxygenase (phytanoyl-CoA dioxygenase family)
MGNYLHLQKFVSADLLRTDSKQMDTKKSETEELATKFEEDGYVVLKLEGIDDLIDEINTDVENLLASGEYRTNSKIYSYNDSPRIVESWRYSLAAKSLAFNEQIIEFLRFSFDAKPLPFSTINFLRSTEQPLHSDYVHFGTKPAFMLAAAWIALEDIDHRSGPIQIVKKSHLMPEFRYSDLGIPVARSLGDIKRHYGLYEDWVRDYVASENVETYAPKLSKGDAIVWKANLLHGSPDCIDNKLSRRSQVIHYHFENTDLFYNPSFSDPASGKFVQRDVKFIPND